MLLRVARIPWYTKFPTISRTALRDPRWNAIDSIKSVGSNTCSSALMQGMKKLKLYNNGNKSWLGILCRECLIYKTAKNWLSAFGMEWHKCQDHSRQGHACKHPIFKFSWAREDTKHANLLVYRFGNIGICTVFAGWRTPFQGVPRCASTGVSEAVPMKTYQEDGKF